VRSELSQGACSQSIETPHDFGRAMLAGRGTHSSNKQSNLRKVVVEVLQEYNLSYSEAGSNTGAMWVDLP
jgi:hypothetical protein